MQKGQCAEGLSAKRSLHGGVRGGVYRGSECKKVIVWRGCAEGCAEGLSAKRLLRRGSECKKVIVQRGAWRV